MCCNKNPIQLYQGDCLEIMKQIIRIIQQIY